MFILALIAFACGAVHICRALKAVNENAPYSGEFLSASIGMLCWSAIYIIKIIK